MLCHLISPESAYEDLHLHIFTPADLQHLPSHLQIYIFHTFPSADLHLSISLPSVPIESDEVGLIIFICFFL